MPSRRNFLKTAATTATGLTLGAPQLAKAIDPLMPAPLAAGGDGNGAAKTGSSVLNLPKGGGAVKGIGETFQVSPFTGTGNFSVPIYTSPGRGGMTPQLSLQYSTGAGNGPFGMGWNLSVPMISRKTEKGNPQYDDRQDTFILSGAEDLVPYLSEQNGQWQESYRVEPNAIGDWNRNKEWHIYRYRPRTEGLHALIEFWRQEPFTTNDSAQPSRSARCFWKIITKDNVTNIYGFSEAARLSDPAHDNKVFQWLLELSYDATGNCIVYKYQTDTPTLNESNEEKLKTIYESHRVLDGRQVYNHYLTYIHYGNRTQIALNTPVQTVVAERLAQFHPDEYLFSVQFDYSAAPDGLDKIDARLANPLDQTWAYRPDPFSSYRAGFEIRTYRLCRRVLMWHRFPELGKEPCLVRSTDFTYQHEQYGGMAQLEQVIQRGYRKTTDNKIRFSEDAYLSDRKYGLSSQQYAIKSFPPLALRYSAFEPAKQRFKPITADGNDLPPGGLATPDMALVDLFGTGLQDVLYTSEAGYYYWKNEGNFRFSRRRTMRNMPNEVRLSNPGVSFGDMAGDGQADLLVQSESGWGIYEANGKAGWKNFRPYKSFPSFSFADPSVRLMDLTGDCKSDAVRSTPTSFYWFRSEGEKGFAEPKMFRRTYDLAEFPDVDFSSPRVKLADMSGDGLQDIVLLHSGRIDYWANLGYGKFSKRITLANAPHFGHDFDPRRLFFADLDGSGTADMIYVEANQVRFWFNRSGNAWSETFTIYGTPAFHDYAAITPADMLGNGCTGLLYSDEYRRGPSNYRFLDFTGGLKPHLLVEMNNNMGSTTRVRYQPSTYFYLQDLKLHPRRNWVSTLPFPVQCIEKVEHLDRLSGNVLATRYAYHHGYYDGQEREFRGFACVEQWDTERIDLFKPGEAGATGFSNLEPGHLVTPSYTKTWYHTGAMPNDPESGTSRELQLDIHELFRADYYRGGQQLFSISSSKLDLLPNRGAVREAYRALRGTLLRQEVYAQGSTIPYTVQESAMRVKQLQPKNSSPHAVFQSLPLETLHFYYEQNPDDPRITQDWVLATDQYGAVTKSASIAYPRMVETTVAAQNSYLATYTTQEYINLDQSRAFWRLGLPCNTQQFELLIPSTRARTEKILPEEITRYAANLLQFDEYSAAGIRRIGWHIVLYKKEAMASEAEAQCTIDETRVRFKEGVAGPLALPWMTLEAAFPERIITKVLNDYFNPINVFLESCGYCRLDFGDSNQAYWFKKSEQQAFDPDRFYLPSLSYDPFFNDTSITYDAYDLLPTQVKDPLKNVSKAENDYITLQPWALTDPNGNRTEVAFDALGMVVGTALIPSTELNEQGDSLQTFNPLLEHDELRLLTQQPTADKALGYLGSATSAMAYNLWAAHNPAKPEPPVVYAVAREIHGPGLQANQLQQKLLYFDSFGRELQTRLQFDDLNPAKPWLCSGWKLYNNKGKIVRQFEPFFAESPAYNLQEAFDKQGVSSILCYDPMERNVCTIHPNGTFSKVVFDAWLQVSWDVNDTVHITDPSQDPELGRFFKHLSHQPWLIKYQQGNEAQQQAAVQTLRHQSTPSQVHLDALGRPVRTVQDKGAQNDHKQTNNSSDENRNENGSFLITDTHLDIQGNEISIVDPRGIACFQYTVDMLKRRLVTRSADAGLSKSVPDVLDQIVWSQNAEGYNERVDYDKLRRPTTRLIRRKGPDYWEIRLQTVYGEDSKAPINARGRVWKIADECGVLTNESFDFKGNVVRFSRTIDAKLDNNKAIKIDTPFVFRYRFDALNRVTSAQLPDLTIKTPEYNKANLLQSLALALKADNDQTSFVRDIQYNAKGQREKIQYGNGVTTFYTYEPETYRLLNLRSLRVADQTELQNLEYTYDPSGNITQILDKAIASCFYKGQKIESRKVYHYDPLYRLIAASGHELEGRAQNLSHEQFLFRQAKGIPLKAKGKSRKSLQHYSQTFAYDKAGNLLEIKHHQGLLNADGQAQGAVVRKQNMSYSPFSNRIEQLTCSEAPSPKLFEHDQTGNITNLFSKMAWDYRNQLVSMSQTVDNTEKNPATYYCYDSNGNRLIKAQDNSNFRIYLGDYEVSYKKEATSITHHIMDDQNRIALLDYHNKKRGHTLRYQLNNHLGSHTQEIDAQGQCISSEDYYAYGGTAFFSFASSYPDSTKRYRYSSKERDEESGLYYYGARYYAPWLGRWCGCDPAGKVDGENLYSFLNGKILNLIDIHGLTGGKPDDVYSVAPQGTTHLTSTDASSTQSPPSTPPPASGDDSSYSKAGAALGEPAADLNWANKVRELDKAGKVATVGDAAKKIAKLGDNVTLDGAKKIAQEAYNNRNALRTADQNKLGPIGKLISKIMDKSKDASRTFEALIEKRLAKGMTEIEAYKDLATVGAGKGRESANLGAKGSKYLGSALAAVGVVFSGYSFQKNISEGKWFDAFVDSTSFASSALTLGALVTGSVLLAKAGLVLGAFGVGMLIGTGIDKGTEWLSRKLFGIDMSLSNQMTLVDNLLSPLWADSSKPTYTQTFGWKLAEWTGL